MNALFPQSTLADTLTSVGYAHLPFQAEPLAKKVLHGWSVFLKEDDAVRREWRVGCSKDWDDGYVYREPSEQSVGHNYNHDHKHFFHFRPSLVKLLADKGVNWKEHAPWLSSCNDLYQACRRRLDYVATELDRRFPDLGVRSRMEHYVAESSHVLRLLAYMRPSQKGEELAKFHGDRCFLTLHVAETHPGLTLHGKDGSTLDYKPTPEKVLVFSGYKAAKLTAGELPNVVHGVVAPEAHAEPRMSAVFFSHVGPSWDKDDVGSS